MAATRRRRASSKGTAGPPDDGAPVEAEAWEAVDALRGGMDAAEYKRVVLGLVFLKHASDAFEEARIKMDSTRGIDPEDPDEYRARNIFWVPPEGRWSNVEAQARRPTIGETVDDAAAAIERENPAIRGALPKNYARPSLGETRLSGIIDVIGGIGGGDEASKGAPGRVYEHFLYRFACVEGRKGGEFYAPRSVVRLLVEMLQPYGGSVYDPCCGSAGTLAQAVEFIRASGDGDGSRAAAETSIWGQESNYTAWQLAKMNLAIRGVDASRIALGDALLDDRHPDLKADFILAIPPFSASEWGGERLRDDRRWVYGTPPKGNANFAWVQHVTHHLAPSGAAGFALANGSMWSNRSGEGEIRRRLVEADLVDCIVALPGQLFHSTRTPACLWFLSRDRASRSRRGDVLFVDARGMGRMLDRTHLELTGDDASAITRAYRAWRGDRKAGGYADAPGFCKSVKLEEIRKHGHVLAPDRYVGDEPRQDDDEPFELKMSKLLAQWTEQRAEARRLDAAIIKSLKDLGFPVRGGKR